MPKTERKTPATKVRPPARKKSLTTPTIVTAPEPEFNGDWSDDTYVRVPDPPVVAASAPQRDDVSAPVSDPVPVEIVAPTPTVSTPAPATPQTYIYLTTRRMLDGLAGEPELTEIREVRAIQKGKGVSVYVEASPATIDALADALVTRRLATATMAPRWFERKDR